MFKQKDSNQYTPNKKGEDLKLPMITRQSQGGLSDGRKSAASRKGNGGVNNIGLLNENDFN